jgi:hypothetical protein
MATTIERIIPVEYDKRGNPVGKARMSAPDNSIGVMSMVPDRVIPIIFVPGVMGSNLIEKGKEKNEAITWRLDGSGSAGVWGSPTRGANFRKRYLQPQVMEVDRDGAIPQGTLIPDEELRRRGWGEVGALSYGPWLVWLENALHDYATPHSGERMGLNNAGLQLQGDAANLTKEEIGLTYRYRFPVHACGYNWLDSNAVAAKRLGDRIDEIRLRYQQEKKKCDKVIIVTHSMGGLVARHCSEVDGYGSKILGIVHGVMPAIGAAAVYRRFKAGTEDTTAWYDVEGAVVASALGNDAAEMTAVLSSAPGPLQLLPTPEYGSGWLKIKDGKTEYSLPKPNPNGDVDPYSEIYTVRSKWWSMCEDHLINPLNEERNPKKRQAQINKDWVTFAKLIIEKVKLFHDGIRGRYHSKTHAFTGVDANSRAYGNVTWTGNGGSWRRGDRSADILEAKPLDLREIKTKRTVAAALSGSGWYNSDKQTYKISEPDEDGDGTVPQRSGRAVRKACRSYAEMRVGHEPAYKFSDGAEYERACRFTLRAIVKIAQDVQLTSLKYD